MDPPVLPHRVRRWPPGPPVDGRRGPAVRRGGDGAPPEALSRGAGAPSPVLATSHIRAGLSSLVAVRHYLSRSDGQSRVGRRRGTVCTALFRRPPSEPCMQLSLHTALQWTGSCAGWHSVSHLPPSPPAVRLLPFALWPAFPTAPVGRHPHDYYGSSVALGLALCRPSRLPSVVDVRARRRCLVRPLQWTPCPPSTRRRVPASATSTPHPGGPASDALQGTCPCITGG
jgi:hypothetical protein